MKRRINISLDEIIDDKMNDFCKRRGMTKSRLIAIACDEYIKAQDQIPQVTEQLKELIEQIEKLKKV